MVIRPADADEPPDVVGVWYTVQKGDFLTALAQKYGVPPEDIIEVNALDHPERLEVGQRLFMPGIEKLVARAAPPPGTGRAQQQKRIRPPDHRPGADALHLAGDHRGAHRGLRQAGRAGAPGHRRAGTAQDAHLRGGRWEGRLQRHLAARLRPPDHRPIHGGDVVSVYAHNERNLVDEGDTVRQGQKIAEVGSSGKSREPHLHFEMRMKGKPVDPLVYLPAR
ncbi:MAG: LysM peptidoglycan-binding domain-containing M23 family metallopeptidase [bacterium]